MRIDRRFVIVVGLSLAWAFVVSVIFYRAASSAGKKRPLEPEKSLVVAVGSLPTGAVITADTVKLVQVPEKLFPRGGFSRPEEVLDRSVISPIQPDEPLVEARLATRGSGGGVAPLIPPGMRAMAVRVNDVAGVAGFVLPGMRVDVLVTGRALGRDDTVTTTVLQNIVVLSAGKTIQVDAKSQSISAPVVTLLVDPAQAEILTLANHEGHIQLVLRNSVDQNLAKTKGQQLRELLALDRPPAAAPAPPAGAGADRVVPRPRPAAAVRPAAPALQQQPSAPAPYRVLVIRGNQKTEESVEFERLPEITLPAPAEKPRDPASGLETARTEEPQSTQEESPK